MPFRSTLDSATYIAHRCASSRLEHAVFESETCRSQQRGSLCGYRSDRKTRASIGPIAIELCRNIDVDEVTFAQHTCRRRDAMSKLIVDADACGAWESICK